MFALIEEKKLPAKTAKIVRGTFSTHEAAIAAKASYLSSHPEAALSVEPR